jgi:iron complex outermembrane receptor protein
LSDEALRRSDGNGFAVERHDASYAPNSIRVAFLFAMFSMAFRVCPVLAQSTSPAPAVSPVAKASPVPTAAPQAHPSPAVSPAAKSSPAAAPQAHASPGIEEIFVTAQKRTQLAQNVPIALTVLDRAEIQFRRIQDLSDLAMQVPGMQYGMDLAGGQQVFIRGVGLDDTSNSIESPIATYVDGIYQPRTFRAPTLGLDLDRIEVLKGPQGTLFGRNATGGAILVNLLQPTDELSGTFRQSVGSYDQVNTEITGSGPIIKNKLDLRISGGFYHDGGWVVNAATGNRVDDHMSGAGRVALASQPLDNLSIANDLILSKLVGGGVPATDVNIQLIPPAEQKKVFGHVIPRNLYINGNNPWKGLFDFRHAGDKEDLMNGTTIKWDFAPWASLKSLTGFQSHTAGRIDYDEDGTAANIVAFHDNNSNDRYISQELNLQGRYSLLSWGDINWIVGAYYGDESYASFFPHFPLFFSALTGTSGGREQLQSWAGFGDMTIPLPHQFSLFGGVRYTYDRKKLNQTVALRLDTNGPFLNIPGTTCNSLKTIQNFHNVSYRVGTMWAPTESVNFYVKYSTGYNAGGTYFDACGNSYKPETLNTLEGGLKGRWFDGRVVADMDGFWNTWNDFQIFQFKPPQSTELINAPKAESWGGEFAITTIPIENLKVDTDFFVMHSQFENFFDADPVNPKAGIQDLSGTQLLRAPNHTEYIGLEYYWPVPWEGVLGAWQTEFLHLGALQIRGEWYHTDYLVYRPFGKSGFAGDNDYQHPYSIYNFYAELHSQDERWNLRFFAKNFTAQKYYSYKQEGPQGWNGVGGQPRWFGGELTYHFW